MDSTTVGFEIHELTPIEEFGRTVGKYQETRFSSGALAASDYAKGAESGKATNTGSSQTIVPSASDFIADIEISARRSLSSGELAYFNMYYRSGVVVAQPPEAIVDGYDPCLEAHVFAFPPHLRFAVRRLDYKVRHKLGSRLIFAGIAPPTKYTNTKDVRMPRRPGRKWSHLY